MYRTIETTRQGLASLSLLSLVTSDCCWGWCLVPYCHEESKLCIQCWFCLRQFLLLYHTANAGWVTVTTRTCVLWCVSYHSLCSWLSWCSSVSFVTVLSFSSSVSNAALLPFQAVPPWQTRWTVSSVHTRYPFLSSLPCERRTFHFLKTISSYLHLRVVPYVILPGGPCGPSLPLLPLEPCSPAINNNDWINDTYSSTTAIPASHGLSCVYTLR